MLSLFRSISLPARLLAPLALPVLAAVALLVVLERDAVKNAAGEATETRAYEAARLIAAEPERVREGRLPPGVRAAAIIPESFDAAVSTDDAILRRLRDPAVAEALARDAQSVELSRDETLAEVHTIVEGRPAKVALTLDAADVRAEVTRGAWARHAAPMGVLLVAAVAASALAWRRALRPVRAFASALERRRAGEASARVPERGGGPDVDRLGGLVNRVLDAEDARAREREVLAMVAARTSNLVIVTDAQGRTEWVNEAFERRTAFTLEEMRGRKPGHLLQGPGTDAGVVRAMGDAVRRGEPFVGDVLNYSRSGAEYWLSIEIQPVRDARGSVTGFISVGTDVTERKRTEAELRAAHERAELVLEATGTATWVWDVGRDAAYFDERYERQLGYAPGELGTKGSDFFEMLHPDDRARVRAAVDAHFTRRERYALDVRLRAKDGSYRVVHTAGRAEFDAEGRPVRMAGTHTDVTEARAADAERDAARERYAAALDASLDAFLVLRAARGAGGVIEGFVLVDANRRAQQLTGVPLERLAGADLGALFPAIARRGCLDVYRRVVEEGVTFEGDVGVDEGGPPAARVMRVQAVKVGDGLAITARDVSEERRAQAELAASRDRLQLAVNGSSDALWDWDVLSDSVYFAPRFREAAGLRPTDLPDGSTAGEFLERVHPEDAQRVHGALWEHLERGAPYDVEFRLRAGDGAWRWFRSRATATRDEGGNPVRMSGFLSDVHERRESEERLQRYTEDLYEAKLQLERQTVELALKSAEAERSREEAQKVSAAKSAFLANMSHEIRTPLNAILGFAELFESDQADPGQRREWAQTIRRNGEHLLRLLSDVLDFSKIEAGRMTVTRAPADAGAVVRDVAAAVAGAARAKGVGVECSVGVGVPASLALDSTRVRQILLNLAGNAVKFTDAGSVALRCSYDDAARALVVDVTDTGAGIDPARAGALFSAFTQADDSTTRRHGGSGLGLVISRRLARLMGGDVELVAAAPARGSHFRLTLPASRVGVVAPGATPEAPGAKARGAEAAPARALEGARILLAEDGPDNQRLIAFHLKRAGAEVALAENGLLAVRSCARERAEGRGPDLVLMDMQMPEMDGFQATARLRAEGYPGPIVALTASALPGDRERCLAVGCDDYATKPIDGATLVRLCRDAIDRCARRGPASDAA